MKKIIYKNFNIINDNKITLNSDISVIGNKISEIGKCDITGDATVIDGKNKYYLSAGFIDLHTHGGAGFDFMDADAEEYSKIAYHHACHGTTSLYPTTLAASHEELLAVVNAFDKALTIVGGAVLLGIHLEGPYIAVSQKGAMDEKYIRNPVPQEYRTLCAVSENIKRITIAPELEGAAELGQYLVSRGILPSVGHTDAVAADVVNAYENGGFRLMTHLYSAMSMTRRIGINRYAGAVEAAYLLDGMDVEIIADGIHLPPELLKLIYKIKGGDHIALITDSMRGSGMPEGGTSILGSRKYGQTVLLEDGVAKLCDRTAFAGSIATADRLIRTMINKAEVPLACAVKMMSETPARIMGILNQRGTLDSGKFADIVVFDDDINIKLTSVEGKIVYNIL